MRNETMYRLLMGMAEAGAYHAAVRERVLRLATRYQFSQADLDALDAAQARATGGTPSA